MEASPASSGIENAAPKQTIENHKVGDANVRLGYVETKPQNPRKFIGQRIEKEGLDKTRGVIFVGAWNWGPDVPIMRGYNPGNGRWYWPKCLSG